MTAAVIFMLAVMALLLIAGVWIGVALMGTGILSLQLFRDMPVHRILARDVWGSLTADELVTLPLFIFMGDLLFHTKLSESLFRGLAPWVNQLPGRLFHVNVLGCTLFAAVSGSSAATSATVGRITLTELVKRGYNKDVAMGSLAGAGTLGLLIPPSIPMVVYGVLADTSILDLFLAGVVPGLMIAFAYMVYLGIQTTLNPALCPPREPPSTWGERWRALGELFPVMFLILLVMGSMYTGIASVTEAAAVGVLGAALLAALQGGLTLSNLKSSLLSTVKTCSMIGLILLGALFLGKAMAFLAIPQAVADWVASMGLNKYTLVLALLIFYLVLGTALDGLSAIVITLPVVLPLIKTAGFNEVWFGIFLIITVELSNISPPVGFNLFVVQQMAGESQSRVAKAALPFCFVLCAFVALMAAFPQIVEWLPQLAKSKP